MGRRLRFTDEVWTAHAAGASEAEARRILKAPSDLTPLEQTAYCEGYYAKREELLSRTAELEIHQMLSGGLLKKLVQKLVQ